MRRILIGLVTLLAVGATPAAGKLPNAPNDAYWGKQWGLRQIEATKAWSHSTGAGQRIAMVGWGIDLEHPDLRDQVVGGATFGPCPKGPRPCGNGGWQSGERSPRDLFSPNPHGTHVAGIAAAATNNRKGIAGVAPDAKLLTVKVGTDRSIAPPALVRGVRWAANHGADVINISMSSSLLATTLSATGALREFKAAVAYAHSKGAVVVVMAGSHRGPICETPSFEQGALCVVATDRFRRRVGYSNLGVKPRLDVVAAPGGAGGPCEGNVISAVPPESGSYCADELGPPNYAFFAGTFVAAPHVAGLAALLTAQGRSVEETMRVIKATARTPGLGTGFYTPAYGWGIVDADAAVAAP